MNTTQLERVCFPVTFQCNLRCRLCAEFSPYYKNPYNPSFDFLAEQITALFGCVDYIGKFDITGGEPFLRKDLPDTIRFLFDNYREKIGKVRVTTNGTLLPPDGFAEAAKLWNDDFYVIVDRYAVSDKSDDVGGILRSAGIPFEIRDYSGDFHCDGWVDYGDLTRKHTEEKARELYNRCVVPKLGFFSCMVNGNVYPCARARLLHESGIAYIAVSLFDTALSDTAKTERLKSLLGDEIIEACKYCNGLCEDSKRYVPAEQLENADALAESLYDFESLYGEMVFYTQTYNNEKTIARTIESVLNQTNGNFTYVVADNGSADGTSKIIKEYAGKDKRILTVRLERNDILAAAAIPHRMFGFLSGKCVSYNSGTYYCIVDGDDYIESDFLETVHNITSKQDVDMVVPGYTRINNETGEPIFSRAAPENIVVEGNGKVDNFMVYRPMLLCQWGKVFRYRWFKKASTSLMNRHFSDIPLWFNQQDTVGVLSRYYLAERVAFTSKSLYMYSMYPTSTMASYTPHSFKNDALVFRIYNEFLDKFDAVDKTLRDYCYCIYLSLIEYSLYILIGTDKLAHQGKLTEITELLDSDETRNLFAGSFDPMFNNLRHRKDLLNTIGEYVSALPESERATKTANAVVNKLDFLSNLSNHIEERIL